MTTHPIPVPRVAPTGPYLAAALICERILEEKDGVLSIIRVVDRVIQTASGPAAPERMPPFNYAPTVIIILKSGMARGTVQIRIDMETPSGIVKPGPSLSALMEGEDRGQNVILRMQMLLEEPGLNWFRVYVDDAVITRIPFRVVYTRIGGPAPQ